MCHQNLFGNRHVSQSIDHSIATLQSRFQVAPIPFVAHNHREQLVIFIHIHTSAFSLCQVIDHQVEELVPNLRVVLVHLLFRICYSQGLPNSKKHPMNGKGNIMTPKPAPRKLGWFQGSQKVFNANPPNFNSAGPWEQAGKEVLFEGRSG